MDVDMIKSNLQAIKRDALSTIARIDAFLDYLELPESDAELQRAADASKQTCPDCAGTGGSATENSIWICSACNGSGQV